MFFNDPPIVIIKINSEYVKTDDIVILNGSESYVLWGTPSLQYKWSVITVPDSNEPYTIDVQQENMDSYRFIPEDPGDYTISLTVSYNNVCAESTSTVHVLGTLEKPNVPIVSNPTSNSLNISWESVPFASSYRLYRDVSSLGSAFNLIYEGESDSYEDNALSHNRTYYYKVCAVNSLEVSAFSNTAQGSTLEILPLPPNSCVITTNGPYSLKIDWEDVANVTKYELYRDISPVGAFTRLVYIGIGSEYIDTDLEDDTIYYYKIKSLNISGESDLSSGVFSGRTGLARLHSPTNLHITDITNISVQFEWNPVSGAANYLIEESLSDYGEWNELSTVSSTSFSRDGLFPGLSRLIRITAIDAADHTRNSEPSDMLLIETSKGTPSIPNAPILSEINAFSLHVNWESVPDASSYEVYRERLENGIVTQSSTVFSGTVTEYSDISVSQGSTYRYKVRGVNIYGNGHYSSPTTCTMSFFPPDPPTRLRITSRDTDSVTIDWNDEFNAMNYYIYRATSIEGDFSSIIGTTFVSEFTDSGLDAATTYYYKISSINHVGSSTLSEPIAARTRYQPIPTPQKIYIIDSTETFVEISWDSVSEANSYLLEWWSMEDFMWEQLGIFSNSNYARISLVPGTKKQIRVTALHATNNDSDSIPSTEKTIYTKSSCPKSIKVINGNPPGSVLELQWEYSLGANSYDIFVANSENGVFEYVANSTSTTFTHTDLAPNTIYYYKLRAINYAGNGPFTTISIMGTTAE